MRCTLERRGCVPACPDDVVEEAAKRFRLLGAAEFQLDDHVVLVADRPPNPVPEHAAVSSCGGEAVECLLPRTKIGDPVFDAEGENLGLPPLREVIDVEGDLGAECGDPPSQGSGVFDTAR